MNESESVEFSSCFCAFQRLIIDSSAPQQQKQVWEINTTNTAEGFEMFVCCEGSKFGLNLLLGIIDNCIIVEFLLE
jgi:hypothetical protein